MKNKIKEYKSKLKSLWDHLMLNLSGHKNVYKVISDFSDIFDFKELGIKELIAKEKELRLIQNKSLESRLENKIDESKKFIHEIILELQTKFNKLVQETKEKLTLQENNLKKLKLVDNKSDYILERFEHIEDFSKQAEKDYDKFLRNLKRDVSEFTSTHQVPRRMASIEERTTLMEGILNSQGKYIQQLLNNNQLESPHGRGENRSGTISKD